MKILFLDIDGVLNSEEWAFKKYDEGVHNALQSEFDVQAVERLNTIIEKSGAKVVISSSWRLIYSLEHINSMLTKFGFKGEIVGRTPSPKANRGRGYDIKRWLTENSKVTTFAILDDDNDMDGVRDRFVQTSWTKGLQDEHIPKVLALLT